MLPDFHMICHQFPDRPDLKIYPISDVHLGAAEHMASEWNAFCKKILDDPDAKIILGGDLLNNSTRNIEDLYRENIAFVKIQMGEQSCNGLINPTYSLVVTHGAGGGMLTGGAVNRAERFGYAMDGADALILGHTHKPYVTQPSKIYIDTRNNKVTLKPFKVVSMTSFLTWGGYAAQKMLLPTSNAPQLITLKGRKKEISVTM